MTLNHLILHWLQAGLVWFFLALALLPTNKLYQQGLVALFWIPALVACVTYRNQLAALLKERKAAFLLLGLLALWVTLSLSWSDAENPAQRAKRLLYPFLFCVGMGVLALTG